MTPNPETVKSERHDRLRPCREMDVGGYRHLPVVEEEMPVGIISVRNVIRHITRLCKDV